MTALPFTLNRSKQFVCVFLDSNELAQTVQQVLSRDALQERYILTLPESDEGFFSLMEQQRQQLDCLILQHDSKLPQLIAWLHEHTLMLPAIILDSTSNADSDVADLEAQLIFLYHSAEIRLPLNKVGEMAEFIDQAIDEFLNLSPSCRLPNASSEPDMTTDLSTQNFLLLHQRRLTEKLKERLGYLGVYYKRNAKAFLRYLPLQEREQLLSQLRLDYRAIILNYFIDENGLNQRIDDFVNTIFFADIPVAQIVEIHMELMDEFAKQLKLEGRSEDILLDYRLTLIDTIAHLCEMYRRSIPRGS